MDSRTADNDISIIGKIQKMELFVNELTHVVTPTEMHHEYIESISLWSLSQNELQGHMYARIPGPSLVLDWAYHV